MTKGPKLNPDRLKTVIALTHARVTQREIARRLNVSRDTIFRYQKHAGLRKWQKIPAALLQSLTQAILNREGTAKDLAHRYGLGIHRVLDLVHKLLGPGRIRPGMPGRGKTPLESTFPQKWPTPFKARKGE